MIFTLVAGAWAGEVTLWHAYRGDERAAIEALAARWGAEHPGTTVEPVFVSYESLASKIEATVPRGNGPDLFIFAHERVADWSAEGLVLSVEPPPGLHPVTVEAVTWEGKVWAWPLAYKSLGLFYNRALVSTPPTTTDALIRTARGLAGPDRWGFAYESASAYANAAWMHGFGGGVFQDGVVRLDRPENVAAFGFIRSLAEIVPAEPSGALVTQLFNEGRVAMVLNGPWFLGEVSGIDYGVAPLPVVSATGLPAAPYVTVEGLFLARENPEARAFGAWLASDEAAAVRLAQGRQLVANATLPLTDPVLAAFRTQLDTSVPMPTRPEMARTWEPLARALRRLGRGTVDPAQALREAQEQYTIVSRPPAPPVDPRPWAVGGGFQGWPP